MTRRAGVALGVSMLVLLAGCGSSAGSDAATTGSNGPKTTIGADPRVSTTTVAVRSSTTASDPGVAGTPAATSVADPCPLLDPDAIQAAYGGASAELEAIPSGAPTTMRGCYVAVEQPAKILEDGSEDTNTTMNLAIHASAMSESDFGALRPPGFKPVVPATKQAYWENGEVGRQIAWFDDGIRYELEFDTASDEIDGAKGFAIMDALAKGIIAKT